MKKEPDHIFRDQPVIGEGEDSLLSSHVANWGKVNAWLRSHPSLVMLKKAVLLESEGECRPQIVDRLLTRIFKVEKTEAMRRLMKQ